MTNKSEYTRIMAMSEACYSPSELEERYCRLIEFVRQVTKQSCNVIQEECLACDALKLLRELKEEK